MNAHKIVLLGPPGAGKGTQAALLAKELNIAHIATGDILREEVKRATPLGRAAKAYMDCGELVPDNVIINIVKGKLAQLDGFVLDGFPRTLKQAQALEGLKIDVAVNIKLSREELIERLSARRVCQHCGRNYNLRSEPPGRDLICDGCGGHLITRSDDQPEVIARRYDVYQQESAPVVEFYRKKGILIEIEGNRAIEAVFQEMLRSVQIQLAS